MTCFQGRDPCRAEGGLLLLLLLVLPLCGPCRKLLLLPVTTCSSSKPGGPVVLLCLGTSSAQMRLLPDAPLPPAPLLVLMPLPAPAVYSCSPCMQTHLAAVPGFPPRPVTPKYVTSSASSSMEEDGPEGWLLLLLLGLA